MTQPNRLPRTDRPRLTLTLRLLLCLAVIVVAHVAPGTAAQVEHRYYLPALMVGRQIAFASDRDGNYYQDLYLMEPDGTSVVRVPGPDSAMCPAWSPTGDRLVFASPLNQDIWMMNPDGSDLVQLTTGPSNDTSPNWSSDGVYVVYATTTLRGIGGISAVQVGQSGSIPLLSEAHDYWDPTWAPDGAHLLFASDRDGTTDIYVAEVIRDVWGLRLGAIVRLTNDVYWDVDPSWSPDGRLIVFASDRDGDNEVYVMKVDGTDVLRLTENTVDDLDPSWSPDGSRIVFTSSRDGNAEIYTMNADGSDQTNLTRSADRDVCAAWRP